MRLPNGFGTVYKLSGKRRRPWIARKTSGWEIDQESMKIKQQYITIGYYPTRKEAMEALVNYNKNPYDIDARNITLEELYEKWSYEKYETLSPGAVRNLKAAWSYSEQISAMRIVEIKAMHLEQTIKHAKVGDPTKARMKSLYNQLFDYAIKHDIVEKNYARMITFESSGHTKKSHVPFTDQELRKIYDNRDLPFAKMILIGAYTGWRPQEMAILKVSDVDLANMTMTGGLKTDAGRNRTVPIHPFIQPFVKEYYDHAVRIGSKFLFNDNFRKDGRYEMSYDKYRGRYKKVLDACEMKHTPHDLRHTFITMAKRYEVNEYCIKIIVGHAIKDITEKVYTERSIEQLHTEIRKIPGLD